MPAAGANPEDGRPARGLTAATGDRYKWVALANTTAAVFMSQDRKSVV